MSTETIFDQIDDIENLCSLQDAPSEEYHWIHESPVNTDEKMKVDNNKNIEQPPKKPRKKRAPNAKKIPIELSNGKIFYVGKRHFKKSTKYVLTQGAWFLLNI